MRYFVQLSFSIISAQLEKTEIWLIQYYFTVLFHQGKKKKIASNARGIYPVMHFYNILIFYTIEPMIESDSFMDVLAEDIHLLTFTKTVEITMNLQSPSLWMSSSFIRINY